MVAHTTEPDRRSLSTEDSPKKVRSHRVVGHMDGRLGKSLIREWVRAARGRGSLVESKLCLTAAYKVSFQRTLAEEPPLNGTWWRRDNVNVPEDTAWLSAEGRSVRGSGGWVFDWWYLW